MTQGTAAAARHGGAMDEEIAGGLLLLASAVLAMVAANSVAAGLYGALLDVPMAIRIGALEIAKPLLLWINDGLMAIFFLLVGLEIKREVMLGALSSPARAGLPAIAAVGGMAAPALIYLGIAGADPVAARGWAIPAATDIAFAVGVVALLGKRVPPAAKLFLLAIAVIDDLGAIIIIAAFYTEHLTMAALVVAVACLVILAAMNLSGVRRVGPYVLVGIILWVAVLKSGVHATLAGVALGLAMPLRRSGNPPPLIEVEHALKPWVTFMVMPVFAFANAGVSFEGMSLGSLLMPVPLAIAAGLFAGKQIGVFATTWAAVRLGVGQRPEGATWAHVYGVSLLAGIGFTMSLFIGGLAFYQSGPEYQAQVRLGVLAGSVISGVAGFAVLWFSGSAQPTLRQDDDRA